ncbi:MAG: insulinase family protein [Gemmatimonadetes bacterium]|nr:insulinase family protein [Gemmatimonadota bacterium]
MLIAFLTVSLAVVPLQALRPDTVFDLEGGPRILLVRAAGSPGAAVRVSVPISEGDAAAAGALVHQHATLARLRGNAATLGAEVDAERTLDRLVYSVRGAVADFEHLVWLVRLAAGRPEVGVIALEDARVAALAEIERTEEVPAEALYAELQRQLAPTRGWGPTVGTMVAALTPVQLEDFWRHAFRRDSIRVTIVADVPVEAVLAALDGLGAPAASPNLLATTSAGGVGAPPTPHRPETLRTWHAVAYVAAAESYAPAVVTARLLASALVDDAAVEAPRVDMWWLEERVAIAIRGAAYPAAEPRMLRTIDGLLSRLRGDLLAAGVTSAASAVRREILLGARTPWGLAALLGRQFDVTGDPSAAERLMGELQRVDAEMMRSFLAALANQPPLRADIRP